AAARPACDEHPRLPRCSGGANAACDGMSSSARKFPRSPGIWQVARMRAQYAASRLRHRSASGV
ncbi:MAG: hypothetical protein AVDCRST_MAG87-421, partial [uncultured Thermomicrobiales bacterium]